MVSELNPMATIKEMIEQMEARLGTLQDDM